MGSGLLWAKVADVANVLEIQHGVMDVEMGAVQALEVVGVEVLPQQANVVVSPWVLGPWSPEKVEVEEEGKVSLLHRQQGPYDDGLYAGLFGA